MNPSKPDGQTPPTVIQARKNGSNFWWFALLLSLCLLMLFMPGSGEFSRIDYSFFLEQLDRQNVQRLTIYPTAAEGTFIA